MEGYMSAREASYKWNVSERRVHQYCQAGRIPGVTRFGRSWVIPADDKAHRSEVHKNSVRSG